MADNDDLDDVDLDPNFEASELLFRRIPLGESENGFVSDMSLPSPIFCIDRGKYCSPLLRVSSGAFGVAAFLVGDIPTFLSSEGGRSFEVEVEHKPCRDNYAHSEVASYEAGAKHKGAQKPSKTMRKIFRDSLRKKLRILETFP